MHASVLNPFPSSTVINNIKNRNIKGMLEGQSNYKAVKCHSAQWWTSSISAMSHFSDLCYLINMLPLQMNVYASRDSYHIWIFCVIKPRSPLHKICAIRSHTKGKNKLCKTYAAAANFSQVNQDLQHTILLAVTGLYHIYTVQHIYHDNTMLITII